ncbi:MAG: type IV pilus secretin family protein [Zetaproteobacteria bacterium]|nr:MAG: type IV pilus secretin family protein [Zetaproteobacteria bacterium]
MSGTTRLFAAVGWLLMMVTGAGGAAAAQLTAVSIRDEAREELVTISSDGPAPYQVFDLSGPARLVLSFPGTSVGDLAAPKGGRVVRLVRLRQQGADGVVELTLARPVHYTIEERGNDLRIHLPLPSESPRRRVAHIDDLAVVDQGEHSELILRGSHLDLPYTARMVNHDMTLILDLPHARARLPREHFSYSSPFVRDVTVGSSGDRVRLVVSLLKPGISHQIVATPGALRIHFGSGRLGHGAGGAEKPAIEVEAVRFKPEDRISHVVLTVRGGSPVVDLNKSDRAVRVTIRGARLRKGLERSMDVSAFPGAVKQIDTFRKGDDVRLVIRLRDKVSVSTFQRGDKLSINIEPQDLAIARAGVSGVNAFSYTGDKVTFDFKDIDIKNALRLIAEMSNLNIIMADDVSGKLTMRLVDVPWDQALDLILTSKGLGQERIGNVLRIAPIEALRSEYSSRLAVKRGSEALEPLITEFITLNYTKVADVKKMIDNAAAAAGKAAAAAAAGKKGGAGAPPAAGKPAGGILSPRGSILVDERTNTLIVKDTRASIDNVKRLVAAIDQPVRQVLIAARVVEASKDFNRDIGIQWGGVYNAQTQRNFPGAISIGAPAAASANAAAIAGGGGTAAATNTGFLVDLPAAAANGSIGISLGSFNNAVNLDLALSAAELNGSAKVVSNPRVVTTNLKPATISQGTKIAVVTSQGANNAATTEYVDATLKLTVTPQITSKDTVLMDVTVSKDSPVGTSANINTKTVTTSVNVKSGETVVIGGVYERTRGDTRNSVPGLASIPVIGWLFQKNARIDNKTELLIFITPQILQNTVTGGE